MCSTAPLHRHRQLCRQSQHARHGHGFTRAFPRRSFPELQTLTRREDGSSDCYSTHETFPEDPRRENHPS